MKKLSTWFRGLKTVSRVAIISALVITFLGVAGASAQPNANTSIEKTSNNTSSTSTAPELRSPKVEVKTETTTESVPYISSTVEDASLDQGVTQTRTVGATGTLTHSFQVTYKEGVETSRSSVSDAVTSVPVNEVIVHGTKAPALSCPNGTYLNSAGNTVCSPYSSSSVPSGATAQCSDGSYSFSQSRSGTCSHRGGVASWL